MWNGVGKRAEKGRVILLALELGPEACVLVNHGGGRRGGPGGGYLRQRESLREGTERRKSKASREWGEKVSVAAGS